MMRCRPRLFLLESALWLESTGRNGYDRPVIATRENQPLYESANVVIRLISPADREEFVSLVTSSVEFLSPWVILPDTFEKFDKYLDRFDGVSAECVLICVRESGAIVGTVAISEIIRGPYQRATVGYNSFAGTARHGYMSEGFNLVFRYAFEELGLHRLEADIQPANVPSLKFAERVGFRQEGYSPGFVCIQGVWRDHERWAVNSDMIDLRAYKAEK
jgi:ribosomal-protein-alanine N-acetyltransferase